MESRWEVKLEKIYLKLFFYFYLTLTGYLSNKFRYLASGANDNLAAVWDGYMMSSGENSQPLHVIRKHRAAVKALGWCPWQSHILATGGMYLKLLIFI